MSPNADAAPRTRLIEGYLPRVRSIARRFLGRGEQLDDLVQVGTLGLIAAVDRCDPNRSSHLTAYVDRCVEGEIRRHLRDRTSPVRVPRRIQRDVGRVTVVRIDEESEGRLPTLPALDDVGVARALVAAAARRLDPREREIVCLRFFHDLSQAEIGRRVGLSQEQVSRVLAAAITKMRVHLEPEPDRLAAV
jgi:RNA polymerase sigma-B factor